MASPKHISFVAFATVSLVGCTGSPNEDSGEKTCSSEDARVEVGAGEHAFEEIADDTELPLVHGPQGGNHILASVRVYDMDPIVSLRYTLTRVYDGLMFSDNFYRLYLLEEGDCQYYYPGLYGYVGFTGEDTEDIDLGQITMHKAELWMEVTDQSGATASDSVFIFPAPDEPPDTGLK